MMKAKIFENTYILKFEVNMIYNNKTREINHSDKANLKISSKENIVEISGVNIIK